MTRKKPGDRVTPTSKKSYLIGNLWMPCALTGEGDTYLEKLWRLIREDGSCERIHDERSCASLAISIE
jgi:hypothetical protein